MNDLNNVSLAGRVGKIEVKDIGNDRKAANLSLAVGSSYKNKNGEWVNNTTWVECVAYGGLAETVLAKFCSVGDYVSLTGELLSRKYEKEGETRSQMYVQMNGYNRISEAKEKPSQD